MRWTKASRGGSGAARRNAIPEAFLLPVLLPTSTRSTYLLHSVLAAEQDGFEVHAPASFEILDRTGPLVYGRVSIFPDAEVARVVYSNPEYPVDAAGNILHRPEWAGDSRTRPIVVEPDGLPPPAQDALTLPTGAWLRVRYNGRHGNEHWWYEKWVFNVAVSTAHKPDVFTQTSPSHVYSRLAALR